VFGQKKKLKFSKKMLSG